MTEIEPRPATSFEVRAELEDLLERDLLGPWDGPEAELPPGTSPAERYLLGRLVPRPSPEAPDGAEIADPGEAVDAEERDPSLVDLEVSAGDDQAGEEDPESETTVRSGSMAASAIGLAFSVPTDVHGVKVAASWGRYQRVPSEIHETEQGRPRTTWHRVQAGGEVEIPQDAEDSGYEVPDPEQEGRDGSLRGAAPGAAPGGGAGAGQRAACGGEDARRVSSCPFQQPGGTLSASARRGISRPSVVSLLSFAKRRLHR